MTAPARLAAIDVALTPEAAHPTQVAVVVDVLRATSTIVAALEAGYRSVLCVGTVDRARELAGPGRRLAGSGLPGDRRLRPRQLAAVPRRP
jgi:2-phosphosulfolactate phosphatase